MPVKKACNSSGTSCSTAYRGIEYRLGSGTQYKPCYCMDWLEHVCLSGM